MAVDVAGHPAVELPGGTLVTVCGSCGQLRSILFLTCDRWLCTRCRAEGASAPNLYPLA